MAISPTLIDLLALRFVLASGVCVAAGAAVWAVMTLCRRWLPGVAAQRSVWLAGQCTIAAAFVLVLLPQNERLRLLPPIDVESLSATGAPAGASVAAPAPDNAANVVSEPPVGRSWPAWGAQAWLLVYALGLGYTAIQLLQAGRALRGLAAAGDARHGDGVQLIEVAAPISPMLFGLLKPRLLLPRHLRDFDASQRQLILEHELTHLRRRDLHWAGAGLLLQTVFWFNPFMRLLRKRLSWAQELGCDSDVLQGRPPAQRRAYAAALVAQLRLQQQALPTALAFSAANNAGAVAGRIALIRDPAAAPRSRWTRIAAAAGLSAVLAASFAFQPTLATPSASELSCTALVDAASGRRLRYDGQCDERATPASTFNIAVALMGYDSGILHDEHAPVIPYKSSYTTWNHEEWRTDTDPSTWIINSTLWYAQQVATRMGEERFQRYVEGFGYGNRDVSGDAGKHNGLTQSWVESSLQISAAEQVEFMRRIVNRQLPVSGKAYEMTARILHPQTLSNGWTIYGKTGTASPVLADGRDDGTRQYGWYVGWATKGGRTIVFARMMLDHRQETYAGLRVKQAFLRDVASQLDKL
ncbi:class D beta-lactamase [Duganella callida]|uniref:Class D beta-lactamase n=1 Tax=Duganella callida TaxID=2561932 RepID=A0A4Y9SIK3_9BURK|nr:class D beta-lactamase [Duganella callida]TFW21928.1 class D beta-lactamase [Duganella callida]